MPAYNTKPAWWQQFARGVDFDTVWRHLACSPSYALGDGRCIAVDESCFRTHLDRPFPFHPRLAWILSKNPRPTERVYGDYPFKITTGLLDTSSEGPYGAIISLSNFRYAYRAGYPWATDVEGFYQKYLIFHRERVFKTREEALFDYALTAWSLNTMTKGQFLTLPSGLTTNPSWTVEQHLRSHPSTWYITERYGAI